MFNPIFDGEEVTLYEMLDAREERVSNQKELLKNTSESLISATLNIPGPIKNSEILERVFLNVIDELERTLEFILPIASVYHSEKTGPVYYQLVPMEPMELKKRMIQIEENHPFGRLVDLDVLWMNGTELYTASRDSLHYPRRKCLICSLDAKECGRARVHSIEEMQAKIIQIVTQGES